MIDWNTVLATILASSAITAITLAVLGFVAKSIFNHLLSRDIEKFKAHLELQSEEFRTNLQQSVFEHQTRYQILHVKRAEVIAELYGLLWEAERDAALLTQFFQDGGKSAQLEKSQRAYESGRKLAEFFEKNRIYFKRTTCKRIDKFIRGLSLALNDFQLVLDPVPNPHNPKERTEKWVSVWKKLTGELHPIKEDIEQEFRGILGL